VTGCDWLVLATHVPPEGGLSGVVRYTTDLIAALARRSDVRVHVLGTRPAAAVLGELVGSPDRVHVVPAVPTLALATWERYGWMPQRTFDVVHGVKHLVPLRSAGTTVLTAHDTTLLDRPADFGRLKRTLLPRPFLASLRDADRVLCVSRTTEARVLAHVPAAAGRTAVVPLATSPALLTARPVPVEELAGRRFAVVVGDSSPRKNLGTIVDAWPRVRAAIPDAVLAVAGPPSWGRSEHGSSWEALVRSGAVLPLGRVPDPVLRWCYEHAAVVLCPSLAEGFGLPAAEALDLGAPVAVSDDPALGEVAAGRGARVLPATDVAAWASEAIERLSRPPDVPRPPQHVRSWDEVADETVRAVLSPAR
jgi:glycosyltransferase involved in cell wall biosynthesis